VSIYQNAKCSYILLSGLLPKYNSRIKCWCDPKISTLYNFASTLLLTFELSLAIYCLFLLQSRTYCTLKFQCFQLIIKASMFPCQVPSHQGSCCTIYNSKLHCHAKIIHANLFSKVVLWSYFSTSQMYFLWHSYINIVLCCTMPLIHHVIDNLFVRNHWQKY